MNHLEKKTLDQLIEHFQKIKRKNSKKYLRLFVSEYGGDEGDRSALHGERYETDAEFKQRIRDEKKWKAEAEQQKQVEERRILDRMID